MRKLIVLLIRAYQIVLSPLFPPSCRFIPTCSQYAIESINRYGAAHGGYLAVRRLFRCHPFCKGGYDPVDPDAAKEQRLNKSGLKI